MNLYDDTVPVLNARFGRTIDEPKSRQRSRSTRHASSGWRGRFVAPRSDATQRVVVKSQIKTMANQGAKNLKKHAHYLLREGAGKDDDARLFGRDPSSKYTADAVDDWCRDRHHFRIILSPEHGARMNLERYTRDVMKHIEKDLGVSRGALEWLAVEHHNTEHPHVHLLVRGSHLTKSGARSDLRIKSHYLHDGIRRRARDVATAHLGPRSSKEIEHARRQSLTALRLTQWDHELAEHTILDKSSGDLLVHRARVSRRSALFSKETLTERLQILEGLRLAEREEEDIWRVKPDFHERLKAFGRHGDIVQAMWRETPDPTRWELEGLPKTHGLYRVASSTEDRFSREGRTLLEGVDGRFYVLDPSLVSGKQPSQDELVVVSYTQGKHGIDAIDGASALALSDYAGPTPLDRMLAQPELFGQSTDGEHRFAKDVHDALRRRREVLAHLAIDPAKPSFLRDLRAWEKSTVLQTHAAKRGLKPVQLGRGQVLRGHLSRPIECRGSTYQLLKNDTYLAVVVAAKHLREHADSVVELRLVEGKQGRLRPVATALSKPASRGKDLTRTR